MTPLAAAFAGALAAQALAQHTARPPVGVGTVPVAVTPAVPSVAAALGPRPAPLSRIAAAVRLTLAPPIGGFGAARRAWRSAAEAEPLASAAPAAPQAWRERTLPLLAAESEGEDLIARTYGYGYHKVHTLGWLKLAGAERFVDDVARDPAMMQHLREFSEFFKTRKLPESYAEARAALSAHLGEVVVYRGVALTPEQAQSIVQDGITSKAARRLEDLPEGLGRAFNDHLLHNGDHLPDPFISVTSYEDVAAAVAADYARDGKAVYVISIRLPELDLIRPRNGTFASFYPSAPEVMNIALRYPDGRFQFRRLDAASESVVAFRILPGEIVGLKRVDAPPVIDDMLED